MTGRVSAGIQGCGLVLLLFPVAHAVVQACFNWQMAEVAGPIFLVVGSGLVIGSLRAASGAIRATMGLLAGFFLWAAVGEIPHHTGRGFHVGPDNWGLILLIGASYLFVAAKPWQSRIARTGGQPRVHPSWQGVQIAVEFFMVVWVLHVVLLTAYYDPRFGATSWMTYAIFGATIALMPILLRALWRIRDPAQGIRAGVLVASLLWTGVEILMKWGVLPKPWKPMAPWALTLWVGGLALWWRWCVATPSGSGHRRAAHRSPSR